MNPQYKIQINVTLVSAKSSGDVQLRQMKYIPFVPRAGDLIRFASDDGERTMLVEVNCTEYDTRAGMFVMEAEDTTLRDTYREQGNTMGDTTHTDYTEVGFAPVNAPTVRAIRTVRP